MEKKQPNILEMFQEMANDHLGKSEFRKAFKEVIDFVKQIDKKITSKFEEYSSELMRKIDSRLSDVRDGKDGVNGRDGKDGVNGRDGADGSSIDENQVIQEVLKQIKLPEQQAIIFDSPDEIRNKLELLQGNERLDKSAIKGLDEELARVTASRSGGIGQPGVQLVLSKLIKHQKFSTSSATTTSTLTHPVAGNVCIWLRYNGQMLHYGDQYTISGTTITYTFTLGDSSEVEVTYFAG